MTSLSLAQALQSNKRVRTNHPLNPLDTSLPNFVQSPALVALSME